MDTETATPPTRRRRRTLAEVRARILDAAHKQFAERGFHAATTRDIARSADVSETLLFRHFGSKANLLNEVMFKPFSLMAERIFAEFEAAPDRPVAPEQWAERIREFLDFLAAHRQLFAAMALVGPNFSNDASEQSNLAVTQNFFDRAAHELSRRQRGGKDAVDPAIAVRLGFAMIVAAELFADWLFAAGDLDRDRIADTISRLLLSR